MAMNRTLGMEAQKMQGYVQEQIERRERRGIVFSDEIKEAIFDYALLIGNEDSVRKLVRDLADAISESQEEKVEDLLYDARQEIQELPDPTVGKLIMGIQQIIWFRLEKKLLWNITAPDQRYIVLGAMEVRENMQAEK